MPERASDPEPDPMTVAVSAFNHGAGNGHGPGLASPSSLRRAILVNLRKHGPMSPDRLAEHLGASRTGVLQQLHALESAGLVAHVIERHGVGRPRHHYDVTPEAQDLFPMDYDGLARGLIDAISSVGGDALLDEVLAARRQQLGSRLRQGLADQVRPDDALIDRVRALAVLQDAAGYVAEATVAADGTIHLREHNCAIFQVSRDIQGCCQAEADLFQDVLGVEVTRESHIASGDRSCSYRIGPAGAD